MKRLLVTGCRTWKADAVAARVLGSLVEKHGPTFTVVHGDAPGVDAAFARVAKSLGLAVEPHPADWDDLDAPGARIGYRKDGEPFNLNAGPDRNALMVRLGADFAVAVHRSLGRSKGTRDAVERCIRAGIGVVLIERNDDPGKWLKAIPAREGARR